MVLSVLCIVLDESTNLVTENAAIALHVGFRVHLSDGGLVGVVAAQRALLVDAADALEVGEDGGSAHLPQAVEVAAQGTYFLVENRVLLVEQILAELVRYSFHELVLFVLLVAEETKLKVLDVAFQNKRVSQRLDW